MSVTRIDSSQTEVRVFAAPLTQVDLMKRPTIVRRHRFYAQAAWTGVCCAAGTLAQVVHNVWLSGG